MTTAKQDFSSPKNEQLWNSCPTVLHTNRELRVLVIKQKRPAEWKPGRPLRGKARCLEPELSAKFRGERMRNDDAARRDITLHFLELGRADVAAVVVAVIGAIGQIEELSDEFQLGPFAEADRL